MHFNWLIKLITLSIFVVSCANQSTYKEISTEYGDSLKYTITDNCFLFDTILQINVSYYNPVNFIDGKNYTSRINLSDSTIELFNLDEKTISKSLKLNKMRMETDSFGDITGLYFHNFDSLFIVQNYRISLWKDDIFINEWKINNENDSMCLFLFDDNPFSYNATNNSIVMQHGCCWCTTDSTEYFNTSPIAYFNLVNKNITTPEIGYSKLYFDNYYGFKSKLLMSHNNNYTLISYIIDPNIYVINNHTKVQKIVGGRSKYQYNPAKPINLKDKNNSERKLIDIKYDFWYHKVQYDAYRNLYLRFFELETPKKNQNGTYNSMSDKERILMVFNDKFELLNEIKFPSKVMPVYYITREGLYVLKYNEFNQWKGPRYFLVKFQ
ncbi:MAG: hypothetical protein KA526_10735 [Chitinophagales bacterium]|nr:hypothetical protein [Chitinophagales bacterium]